MPTFSDNLDGTSGDLLRSRSGWTRTIGADDAVINTGGSGLALSAGTTAASGTWHKPNSQPSGNDQYAEGFLLTGPSGGCRPLCIRADTSSATGVAYTARRNASSAIIAQRRSSAGSFTQLGSFTVSPSSDFDTNKVRVEAVGNQITIYFGATAVIGPVTDTNIASGSVAILSLGGSVTNTDNAVDDIGWGDVATGAMSGSSSVSVTSSGAIAGAGAVSGAANVNASAAGTIAGAGALAGASDIAVAATGSIHDAAAPPGAISGAASVTVSAGGSIAGAGAVSGSASITVTSVAAGMATALMSGASTVALTAAGTIRGSGGVSGAGSQTFAGQGVLRGSGALLGSSAIAVTASAIASGNDNSDRFATVGRPVNPQGTARYTTPSNISRPRQHSSARPRAASGW